ncbi:MAG: hypothetical protein JO264_21100 [Acidisphaera sp.]|nr:hypothetical protein [Acidisphaera sp.]
MASHRAAPANAKTTRRTTGKQASRAPEKRASKPAKLAPSGTHEGAGAQKTAARKPGAARTGRSTAARADQRAAEMLQELRTRGKELTARINTLLERLG